MKKIIAILITLCLFIPLCANQFNYTRSSNEVRTLILLARMTGTALPNLTYPLSGDILNSLLSGIDKYGLSPQAYSLYTELKDKLSEKKFLVSDSDSGFGLELPLLVFQTWTGNTLLPFKDRPPLFSFNADIAITEHFAAETDFDFKAEPYNTTPVTGSLKLLSPYNLTKDLSHQYPSKAYASAGTQFMNLTVGRSKVSAGNGNTGNLQADENFLYQDYAKLCFVKGPLSYDFTIVAYDNPTGPNSVESYNHSDPYKAVFTHRFSAVFGKKLTATVYEGAVVYADNAFSDIRTLNPFMLIHNTFTYENGNINNFFGVEIDAVLPYNLSLDLQCIIDQLKLGDEEDNSGEPAFGILAGLNGVWPAGNGLLTAYAETAFTSRYMYLKELDNTHAGTKPAQYWQLDMTGVNKYYPDGYEQNYMGYRHGSDAFVIGAGASYLHGNHSFNVDFLYRRKGCNGIGTNETRAIGEPADLPDEKTFIFTIGAGGQLMKGLSYSAKTGINTVTNLNHIAGNSNSDKFLFSAGIVISPLEFAK